MGTTYTCTHCETTIENGHFMAVIGTAPAGGLRAPIGRADKIMSEIGQIYCSACFQALGAEALVAAAQQRNEKR